MNPTKKRIAINFGGGYVPGGNAVIAGTVIAAHQLGWQVVGIRDGFDGLLFPERYPEGGLLKLTPQMARDLSAGGSALLGNATRTDPFHVRQINADNMVEEVDLSDELIARVAAENIDAVISIVGPQALSILFRLQRKGLKVICVPTSVENDVAATDLSFGFNSALSFAAEMMERVRQAAQAGRKIAVVEVLGKHAGWLALQSGIAACADAVLIPEIPYDLKQVAAELNRKFADDQHHGLVVVAEGAVPIDACGTQAETASGSLKSSLSPGASGEAGSHVIESSGRAAAAVALELQRLTDQSTYPFVLGPLVKGGSPTVVDRQLGLAYGAAAVRGLRENQDGVMVAFRPPEIHFIPLAEAINKIRSVPANSVFLQTAQTLGIALGKEMQP